MTKEEFEAVESLYHESGQPLIVNFLYQHVTGYLRRVGLSRDNNVEEG